MKPSHISLKTIGLFDLPDAVADALSTHWKDSYTLIRTPVADSAPDLVITASPLFESHAVPVLRLERKHPLSVVRIYQLAEDMIAAPALYLEDINLGFGTLKTQDKIVVWGSREITLTDKEVDIIIYLARARGAPVARQELLSAVWGYQDNIDTHTLETHIYRLRQKVGETAPQLIMTDDKGYFIPQPP